MQENIAKAIRKGWSPELTKAMKLPEQAQRLDLARKIAVKWMEAAREDSAGLWARAQYARDGIEEELSRMCFEMEVEQRRRDYGEELEGNAASDALSDTLLSIYTTLSYVPSELIGDGSPRARYELMGALVVAMDATTG